MTDEKLLDYLEDLLRPGKWWKTASLKLTSKLARDGGALYRIGSGCWKRTLREALESGARNR